MSALAAYTESVRRLRGILARLERHGAHAEASQLAAITAGYCERMRLLCVACAVPPPPYDHPPSDSNDLSLAQPAASESSPPPAYDEFRQRRRSAFKLDLDPSYRETTRGAEDS